MIIRFDNRYAEAKFVSPEFGAKFQREVTLLLKVPDSNFIITKRGIGGRKLPCQNSQIPSAVSTEHRVVTDRHRH